MPAATLLAFAQARDVLGFTQREVDVQPTQTAADVLEQLHPGWREQLPGSRVALDQAYADWDTPLGDAKEIAVLPPVSGG